MSNRFEKSRQWGRPYLFEVIKLGGQWRAREWAGHTPDKPWLLLVHTKPFDAYEDALLESFDQRARRRASQIIGFRR